MSVSIQLVLVARYDTECGFWRAYVKHVHGDTCYNGYTGEGASPDEARGCLLRNLILAGMNQDMMFLDIGTEERKLSD